MTLAAALEQIEALPADPLGKVAGAHIDGVPRRDLQTLRVPINALATPLLVIDRSAVTHNIWALQRWCDDRRYALAPHGKTTMAPQLWARQLDAGAWGITVATDAQLRVALEFGVPRVQLADPLLRREAVDAVAAVLAGDPARQVLTWVDSVAAVERLAGKRPRPLQVLLDIGHPGGRTGVRTQAEAVRVFKEIERAPGVELCGSTGYEGAIATGTEPTSSDVVDYVAGLLEIHRTVVVPACSSPAYLSIGGSQHLPEVALGLTGLSPEDGTVLIRAGAYLAHDDGLYRDAHLDSTVDAPQFRPALTLLATVIAVHDDGTAIIDAGRRDAAHDHGLPVPKALWRGAQILERTEHAAPVAAIYDQHAIVRPGTFSAAPQVGDVLSLGISHPCTTFDRWRDVVELDGPPRPDSVAVGLIRTVF